MDWCPARIRFLPLAAALSIVGCAGGDPNGGGFTSLTFGNPETSQGMDTGDSEGVVTDGPATDGAMTSNASGDSGPGPDPDTGSGPGPDPDTGPDPDAGCLPEAEACDGIDNDCDLQVDNGNPGGGQPCNTGMPGVCAEGITACEGGAIACNPSMVAQAESCNGLDDDCNGEPDDGNPGGGGACNTGIPGVCAAGTNQCTGGALACVGNVGASGETCDNEDDDCNGIVDDGNPGGGGACNTGLQGICGPGTLVCLNGGIGCQQNQGAAGNDLCGNGLDDDCDGQVDDGCGCPFGLCAPQGSPQVNGCDPCVTQICAVDGFCCATAWDSQCVNEVATVCDLTTCTTCSHGLCLTGAALTNGCHPCVSQICAADPFCCNNSWDSQCVGEVNSICGLPC